MTTQGADLDVLKDIPGYKAILKAVLKSQIQLLVEQLSDQTGEESIILTASINDGTLSHLGSHTGKGFLEGRDEIKSQFLGFCLKSHHRKKVTDEMSPLYPPPHGDMLQANPGLPIHQFQPTPKRPRMMAPASMPVPMHLNDTHLPDSRPRLTISNDIPIPTPVPSLAHIPSMDNEPDPTAVKLEKHNVHDRADDTNVSRTGFHSTISMDHTQTSIDARNSGGSDQNDSSSAINIPGSTDSSQDSAKIVKTEPGTDVDEVDLEITNIEMGSAPPVSVGSDSWGQGQVMSQGQMSFGSPPGGEDADQSALDDQASYNELDVSMFMNQVLYGRNQNTRNQGQPIPKVPISSTSSTTTGYSPDFIPKSSNLKIYWCQYCGKALQNKSLYEYHMRAHRGEKPFACNICNKNFAGKQVLETHKRLHTGERPFKCRFCETKFAARAGLDYHVKKNHADRLILELTGSDVTGASTMDVFTTDNPVTRHDRVIKIERSEVSEVSGRETMGASVDVFKDEYSSDYAVQRSEATAAELTSASVATNSNNPMMSLPVFPGM